MIDAHYFGTVFITRAAWPHFVKAGYGRIVNTVSEAMLGGIPELTSYGAAKGEVFGLTRNLATEGLGHGIRVNAIAPPAYTRMSASHSEQLSAVLRVCSGGSWVTMCSLIGICGPLPPNAPQPAATCITGPG
jgi:NAD(P)-dependent dehydrogenase (short-subunit alcohol dehydrogenase family)